MCAKVSRKVVQPTKTPKRQSQASTNSRSPNRSLRPSPTKRAQHSLNTSDSSGDSADFLGRQSTSSNETNFPATNASNRSIRNDSNRSIRNDSTRSHNASIPTARKSSHPLDNSQTNRRRSRKQKKPVKNGARALKEIRFYQKTTDLLIPRLPFQR